MLNNLFWAHQFESAFVPEVRALLDTLETRLLPTFANLKSEADAKHREEWERLGSLPGLSGSTHSGSMATGQILFSTTIPGEWKYIAPDTVSAHVHRIVCTR